MSTIPPVGAAPVSDPRRWRALSVLAFMQFMLILDITVVNVALPSMKVSLGFSEANLAWVVDAYVLIAGGFLLLGGRAADLLGRRRIFLSGAAIFALASLTSGLAQNQFQLIASRAAQGLGEALAAPAALAMVVTLFADPKERARALGIWGGLAGLGGTLGVVLSGVITQLTSWRWIFLINLPIALVVLIVVPRVIPPDRPRSTGGIDIAGAVLITGGITALVYALLEANNNGWLSLITLGLFGLSALMIVTFLLVESKVRRPLIRLGFFRQRRPTVASGLVVVIGSAFFAMFFLLTLYMQQVLGYSPLKAGLAYLTFGGAILIGFGSASQLLPRIGVRPLMVTGMMLTGIGLLYLARLPVDGSYWADLAPAMVVIAFGSGWCFVSLSVTAVSESGEQEAGLASGVLNTAQQIGGALGLAVLISVATSRTASLLAEGQSPLAAQVGGSHVAFGIGAALVFSGAAIAALLIGQFIPESLPVPMPITDQPLEPVVPPSS
ncbi:MAG: DHA2 family efflux MFS transporter permease subunit [Candidatus Dormibacteria bacterium]